MPRVTVYFPRGGGMTMVHDDAAVATLGAPGARVRRLSHIEVWDDLSVRARDKVLETARSPAWPADLFWVDMTPVSGPVLGPFTTRAEAEAAEKAWLASHPEAWVTRAVAATNPDLCRAPMS